MDTFDGPEYLTKPIEFAIRKTPGMRRVLLPADRSYLAKKIVEQLRLSNWELRRGPGHQISVAVSQRGGRDG